MLPLKSSTYATLKSSTYATLKSSTYAALKKQYLCYLKSSTYATLKSSTLPPKQFLARPLFFFLTLALTELAQ